jgi:hypothetical protein
VWKTTLNVHGARALPLSTTNGERDPSRAEYRWFCERHRILVPGQEHELQRRLAPVLQRTLRHQAQEFLDRPFTERRCRLYEYERPSDERSLYDDLLAGDGREAVADARIHIEVSCEEAARELNS